MEQKINRLAEDGMVTAKDDRWRDSQVSNIKPPPTMSEQKAVAKAKS